MAIAILGAGGFIGSHVAAEFARRGEEVVVVSHKAPTSQRRREVWESAAHRVIADLRTEHVDLQGCTKVFNFAADMGGVGYFSTAQIAPYIANSRITFNVLEIVAAQSIEMVFMASSACAYPTQLQQVPGRAPLLCEDMLEQGPADQMYGREKLMVCALAQRVDFDCRVGIFHTVYGDAESFDSERMKFPTAIVFKLLQSIDTGRVSVWGDGSQLRSYLWIDDAVSKVLRVMEGENPGPINIGRQGAISVRDVVGLCCEHLQINPEVTYLRDRPTGVLARDCSNSKYWSLYGEMEPTDYVSGFGALINKVSESRLHYESG